MKVKIDKSTYQIEEQQEVGSGGEAVIYKLTSEQLLKMYDEPTLKKQPDKADRVFALRDKFAFLASLPVARLIAAPMQPAYGDLDQGVDDFCGFTMQYYKDSVEFDDLCYNLSEQKYDYSGFNDHKAHEIVLKLFDILKWLHHERIVLGDINGENILINPTLVLPYIIDIDSAQVGDFKGSVARPDWSDPNVYKVKTADNREEVLFSTDTDIFALTVGCCELMLGINPFLIGNSENFDLQQCKEKKLNIIRYHFYRSTVENNVRIDEPDYISLLRRLDEIKRTFPDLYNFFHLVLNKGKRFYYSQTRRLNQVKEKRVAPRQKSFSITSKSRFDDKSDPKEFNVFLQTYGLTVPNF